MAVLNHQPRKFLTIYPFVVTTQYEHSPVYIYYFINYSTCKSCIATFGLWLSSEHGRSAEKAKGCGRQEKESRWLYQ